MNDPIPLAIASEAFLLLSFFIMYVSTGKSKKTLIILLSIIGGAPLLYFVIDDMNINYEDANIGLGLAFMFTWLYSAIAFIIAIILLVVKKKADHDIPKEP